MKNGTQGFTLIELLIVIAIIGILAAVLIPNLLGARKRAYDTAAQSCASALAKAASIWKIDNATEAGYPAASALFGAAAADATAGTEAPSAKYGTNNCADDNLVVTGNAVTTNSTFEYKVSHLNGAKTFTVTEDGIESEEGIQEAPTAPVGG